MIKGISIMWNNKDGFYYGKWAKGRYAVNNKVFAHKDQSTRPKWGFKIDLMYGLVHRPKPYLLRLLSKKKVGDFPMDEWDKVFDKKIHDDLILADGMRYVYKLNKERYGVNDKPHKYFYHNPWYSDFKSVVKGMWPCFLISWNTPLWFPRNFYFGYKAHKVDPYQNDYTWAGDKESKKMADEFSGTLIREDKRYYYALAMSGSFRKDNH